MNFEEEMVHNLFLISDSLEELDKTAQLMNSNLFDISEQLKAFNQTQKELVAVLSCIDKSIHIVSMMIDRAGKRKIGSK